MGGHTTTHEKRSAIFQNRVSNFQFDLHRRQHEHKLNTTIEKRGQEA